MKNEKLMCGIRRGVFTRSKTVLQFFIFHLSFFILLAGCKEPEPPTLRDPDPKVFIMYDNIGSWFEDDVREAGKVVASGALLRGQKIVVFHKRSGGNVIYELVRDNSKKAGYREAIIHTYAPGENNTFTKETLAAVVGDIRRLVHANRYGFAFGSHGMGWVPATNGAGLRRMGTPGSVHPSGTPDPLASLWEFPENPKTRYLAYNLNQKIDVWEFADALDEWTWDFIIFDDCFMASVEALYEIRHLALFFIASPTEILQYGFPYDRTIKTIFAEWNSHAGYNGVVSGYIDYYKNLVDEYGFPYGGTIAVVRGDQLEPLAASVRAIVESGSWTETNPISADPAIQAYEGMSSSSHVFFDLDDYMIRGFPPDKAPPSSEVYKAFKAQLERTVIAKGSTQTFYSARWGEVRYPVTHYSGLSVFIPYTGTSSLINDYHRTAWYKAVYE